MKHVAIFLCLVVFIVGCHKHKPSGEVMLVGFAVPEYKNKPLTNILVHARVDNLYFRNELEKRMAGQISSSVARVGRNERSELRRMCEPLK